MSYTSFDVICVIWCHLMSNDAYDIKIWHKSILPILVSKVALGPQLYNLWVRFGLRNCYKMKNFEIAYIIFFLYKFWKSFVFLPSSRSERAVTPRPPRVKCIVLLFFLCPYATFKILFIIIGGEMSFSHRPSGDPFLTVLHMVHMMRELLLLWMSMSNNNAWERRRFSISQIPLVANCMRGQSVSLTKQRIRQ